MIDIAKKKTNKFKILHAGQVVDRIFFSREEAEEWGSWNYKGADCFSIIDMKKKMRKIMTLEYFLKFKELSGNGFDIADIEEETGFSPYTIEKYLKYKEPPRFLLGVLNN